MNKIKRLINKLSYSTVFLIPKSYLYTKSYNIISMFINDSFEEFDMEKSYFFIDIGNNKKLAISAHKNALFNNKKFIDYIDHYYRDL